MLCRLASAPSGVLQAVVNHYPSRSLYPGASLSSWPAGRTLKALLLVGTLNWSSSILSERLPWKQCGVSSFWMTTVPKQVGREKPQKSETLMCKELCRKHFIVKKNGNLLPPSEVWQHLGKIGHTHQKCALPFEETMNKWEMWLLQLWVIQSRGPLCGWVFEKDDHCHWKPKKA